MKTSALISVLFASFAVRAFAQSQPSAVPKFAIVTVAGNGTSGFSGDGGPATSASLMFPIGVAYDRFGNLYECDTNRIRKISPDGTITTIAGTGTAGFSGDGGPAVNAMINLPDRVSVDAQGVVYIPDTHNYRIRKVTLDGIITTVAGNGIAGFSGDDGPAVDAEINQPDCTGSDVSGNLYFCDFDNNRIRMVSPSGMITTVAGDGQSGFSGDGGLATSASLNGPAGLAVDGAVLYISDQGNNRIRKVVGGIITTIAGNGTAGYTGDGGPATTAELNFPAAIAEASGIVYIPDRNNNLIRVLLPDATIHTVAGNSVAGFGGNLGPATDAELNSPRAVALSPSGGVYVADGGNNRVRLLLPPPSVSADGITPIDSSATTVQPGSFISLYGTNLAAAFNQSNGNFPTTLGNTSVTIDGKPGYLYFVSPTQINLQAPDDTATGTVPVVVTTASGSATSTVTLGEFGPSFSLLGDPGNHVAGIILRSGGMYDIIGPTGNSLGYPTVAATAGDTIELFGVGFGPTSPSFPAGQVLPTGAYGSATNPVQIVINGTTLTPAFAGITEAGLFQFNLTLPAGLGTGDSPLIATVGSVQTPSGVVIALQ